MTAERTAENPIQLAVITGGHGYDVRNFHRFFRSLPGVDAYIQHMDDFASARAEVRDGYDVALFYTMLMDGPRDDGPWYAGKPETALAHLGETAQGIILLHHAILAYPQWPLWSEIAGIEDRSFRHHPEQTVRIEIARPAHPITAGRSAWQMEDETYLMDEPDEDSEILLTADHPKSMKAIAWARTHKRARVVCFQSGHDNLTWANPGFGETVARAIRWTARRI
ncbi:MAG: ThuA domain-containing protein [Caldilineaceae bacterium]|nr:ThuA domain-containing protein [Caldilineaceae bacterium]